MNYAADSRIERNMNVLLCLDKNYVMPTVVLMTSIGINNDSGIVFHLFTDESIGIEETATIKNTAHRFGNFVKFYSIEKNSTMRLPTGQPKQSSYITKATYYRLFASMLLPNNIHKILYLDCDTIVRKSLTLLWETDITNYAAGCINDVIDVCTCSTNRLPYDMQKGYFNAGVLLINLDYWRMNNVYARFVDCINKNASILDFHDQDVLNIEFCDVKKNLPITYNFMVGFYTKTKYNLYNNEYEKEVNNTISDPTIIHYSHKLKPWHYGSGHPHLDVWKYYYEQAIIPQKRRFFYPSKSIKDILRNIGYATGFELLGYKYKKCPHLNK